MNKNQTIGYLLEHFEKNLRACASNISEIRRALLETESAQSPISLLAEGLSKPPSSKMEGLRKGLSDNAGRGTLGQAIVDSNKGLSDGDKRTAAVNERVSDMVKATKVDANIISATALQDTVFFKEIGHNSTTIFYKRVKGVHRGSVVTVNKKDKTVTDHMYSTATPLENQLCMVSHDQDGIDYVANYVRPSIQTRVDRYNRTSRGLDNPVGAKVVRYYRPQTERYYGSSRSIRIKQKPKTHAAVYFKDRFYLCQ